MATDQPLTAGALRAALDGIPDDAPIQVPIPLSTIDGGEGYTWVDATGIHTSGDTIDFHYDEPAEWGANNAAERQQMRDDMRYAAAYLAASNNAVSEALRMVLDVRLADTPGLDLAAIHEDLVVGLAGAAARRMRTNPPA